MFSRKYEIQYEEGDFQVQNFRENKSQRCGKKTIYMPQKSNMQIFVASRSKVDCQKLHQNAKGLNFIKQVFYSIFIRFRLNYLSNILFVLENGR